MSLVRRFRFVSVLAALFASVSVTAATGPAVANAKPVSAERTAKTKSVQKRALTVTDRKGRLRVIAVGDRSGRSATLQKNSLQDCVNMAGALRNFAVTRNPYLALRAGALTQGCGAWIADAVCWTSRQWWGGGARWLVSQVTWGQYNRC